MSLTREQWLEMWRNAKKIENTCIGNTLIDSVARQRILNNIARIKELIQSVVGQLE